MSNTCNDNESIFKPYSGCSDFTDPFNFDCPDDYEPQYQKLSINTETNEIFADGKLYGELVSHNEETNEMEIKMISDNKYIDGVVRRIGIFEK